MGEVRFFASIPHEFILHHTSTSAAFSTALESESDPHRESATLSGWCGKGRTTGPAKFSKDPGLAGPACYKWC